MYFSFFRYFEVGKHFLLTRLKPQYCKTFQNKMSGAFSHNTISFIGFTILYILEGGGLSSVS